MKILLKAVYPYIFFLLYLIIPFDNYIRAFPNLLLGLLAILFPVVISKENLTRIARKPAMLFFLFFLYLFTSSYLLGRLDEDFSILKKMLIPLGLVLLYLPVGTFDKIKKAVIFSALATILFSLFQFSVFSYQAHDVSLTFFQNTVDALLIDRPYLGLLSVLSILISYQSLTKEYSPYNSYYVINILLNGLYIFLIMSKIAILILVVLILLRQFYGTQKKRTIPLSMLAIIIVGIIFTIQCKPQINKFLSPYKNTAQVSYNISKMPDVYRSIIWKCARQIAGNNTNPVVGMGFRQTNNQLVSCYKESITNIKTQDIFVSNKFNTHNQFMDVFLSSGWVGLVLFTSFWVVLFILYRKEFFPTAILFSMVLFGLTENFLHRQIGAYYFGIVLILLLIKNSNKLINANE